MYMASTDNMCNDSQSQELPGLISGSLIYGLLLHIPRAVTQLLSSDGRLGYVTLSVCFGSCYLCFCPFRSRQCENTDANLSAGTYTALFCEPNMKLQTMLQCSLELIVCRHGKIFITTD